MPAGDPRTALTRVYLLIFSLRCLLYVFATGRVGAAMASARFEIVIATAQVSALAAGCVIGLVWLHRAWSRVPEPCRLAYDGRRVQPGEAIWKLFIPVYGIYWLFIANIGLCGAIENQLKRARARSTAAPSTLALLACLLQLVPIVNLAAPILWAAFMARIDRIQAEADALDPEASRVEPVRWARVALYSVAATVVFFGVAAVLFLAIWGFVNPGALPAPR